MVEGKLVWHRDPSTGDWSTSALDDEKRVYIIHRYKGSRVWVTSWKCPSFEGESIGVSATLVEAKRVADHHHHECIRLSNDEGLKEYARRFPIRG